MNLQEQDVAAVLATTDGRSFSVGFLAVRAGGAAEFSMVTGEVMNGRSLPLKSTERCKLYNLELHAATWVLARNRIS